MTILLTKTEKIFSDWLKAERKAINQTFGRSRGDYETGLRAELTLVEIAFKKALRGEISTYD